MGTVVNWDDAKELELIDVGEYEAIFQEGIVKFKDNGEPQVIAKYLITDDGKYEGRTHTEFYTLSANSMWRIKQDLVAIGVDPANLVGKADIEPSLEDAQGKPCIIKIYHDKYQGNTNAKIKKVKPIGGFTTV